MTEAFEKLLRMPSDVSKESMSLLERFIVLMYDRASNIIEVNDAKNQLFVEKSRALSNRSTAGTIRGVPAAASAHMLHSSTLHYVLGRLRISIF